jgi:hypothetical protein
MFIVNKNSKFLFVFLLTFITIFPLAPDVWAKKSKRPMPIQFEPKEIEVHMAPGESVVTRAKFVSDQDYAKL